MFFYRIAGLRVQKKFTICTKSTLGKKERKKNHLILKCAYSFYRCHNTDFLDHFIINFRQRCFKLTLSTERRALALQAEKQTSQNVCPHTWCNQFLQSNCRMYAVQGALRRWCHKRPIETRLVPNENACQFAVTTGIEFAACWVTVVFDYTLFWRCLRENVFNWQKIKILIN